MEKLIRTIAGWSTLVFLLLLINEAGTHRITIAENVFPMLKYIGLMLLSFHVWEYYGGNRLPK